MANELEPAPFRMSRMARMRGRFYHILFLLRRPMTMGVRAVIHDRATRSIFLIRHTYVPGWQFPGGGIETGETAEDALGREVEEECAIRVTGRPVLRSIHFSRRASRRDHVLVYLVEAFAVIEAKRPDDEIADAGFFRLDALPADTTRATRQRLAEIFKGAEVDQDW